MPAPMSHRILLNQFFLMHHVYINDYFLMTCLGISGRYSNLYSYCQGQPRNKPRVIVHGWLVLPLSCKEFLECPNLSAVTLDFNKIILFDTASGKAAEFGPLKDGYMFESSTGLSRM